MDLLIVSRSMKLSVSIGHRLIYRVSFPLEEVVIIMTYACMPVLKKPPLTSYEVSIALVFTDVDPFCPDLLR